MPVRAVGRQPATNPFLRSPRTRLRKGGRRDCGHHRGREATVEATGVRRARAATAFIYGRFRITEGRTGSGGRQPAAFRGPTSVTRRLAAGPAAALRRERRVERLFVPSPSERRTLLRVPVQR